MTQVVAQLVEQIGRLTESEIAEFRDAFSQRYSDDDIFGDITDEDLTAMSRRAFRRLEQEEIVPACYVGDDFTDEDLSRIAAHTFAEIDRQDEEWARKQAVSKAHPTKPTP